MWPISGSAAADDGPPDAQANVGDRRHRADCGRVRPRADRPGGALASASADLPRPDDAHTGPAAGASTGPGMDRAAILGATPSGATRSSGRTEPTTRTQGGIGEGYQGDGYYPALLDVGLCYQVARGIDPAAAAARYGALGADVLRHMSEPSGPHAPNTLRDSGYGVRFYATAHVDRLRLAIRSALTRPCGRASRLRSRAGSATSAGRGSSARSRRATISPATTRRTPTPRSRWRATRRTGTALRDDWLHRVQDRLVQPYYAANLAGGGWPEGWNYGPIASVNMSLPAAGRPQRHRHGHRPWGASVPVPGGQPALSPLLHVAGHDHA